METNKNRPPAEIMIHLELLDLVTREWYLSSSATIKKQTRARRVCHFLTQKFSSFSETLAVKKNILKPRVA